MNEQASYPYGKNSHLGKSMEPRITGAEQTGLAEILTILGAY
jgi:hypothetical protein